MNKTDVKTFEDLVAFAVDRAKKSVKRNDPIAWSYWKDTEDWATRQVQQFDASEFWSHVAASLVKDARELAWCDPREAARKYSRAKWLRILTVNNRFKNVKPLSLSWLKDSMCA